jgi:DNA-binding transcriptional ArsR family regulator
LTLRQRFDYYGNVEISNIVDALAALAHETRLKVFRLLVQAGEEGLAAGAISEKLALAPATLSFHLAHLARTGLAQSRQEGRFVIYSADFANMTRLVGYLTENCCGGRPCGPATPRVRRKVAA